MFSMNKKFPIEFVRLIWVVWNLFRIVMRYVPKDDLKHLSRCRDLYSIGQWVEWNHLIHWAKRCGIHFVSALFLGSDLIYSSEKDFSLLKRKFAQVSFFVSFLRLKYLFHFSFVISFELEILDYFIWWYWKWNVSTRKNSFAFVCSRSSVNNQSILWISSQTNDFSFEKGFLWVAFSSENDIRIKCINHPWKNLRIHLQLEMIFMKIFKSFAQIFVFLVRAVARKPRPICSIRDPKQLTTQRHSWWYGSRKKLSLKTIPSIF